jgi:pyrroloquinoline quinone (PQQ) biosynthesis protein C
MRAWLTQLYPFIETFPKWIALNIPKTQDDISRGFLIDNIRVEKRHAEQWVYMAEGFGIKRADLYTVKPLPEVDALTHWLWSINTQGSLAEAVGATNYAIEGITQEIAKLTVKGFPHYEGVDGIHLERKAYWWMEAHAKYDDLHPQQALEIMKMYATTKELQDKVTFVSRRSLEYMLMGFETCYTQFQPQGAATLTLAI